MSNRLTKGRGRVGSLAVDTSGGVWFEADKACRKIAAISITAPGSSAETDTNWDLPTYALVQDVWLKITANSTAGGHLSVGLSSTSSGDADGFIYQQGTSSTGVYYPNATFTAATSGDLVTGATRGALLMAHATGTTDLGSWGYFTPITFVSAVPATVTEKSVTFSWKTTQTTPAGTLFIEYTEIA